MRRTSSSLALGYTSQIEEIIRHKQFERKKILIIDDEEFCLNAMRNNLLFLKIDVDYQVNFCMNGQEALNLIKMANDAGIFYKVIFSDFNMPVMDGLETVVKVREMFRDSPFKPNYVGITGYATSKYLDKGLEAGMDEVVSKPLYVDTLRALLDKYYY